VIFRLPLPVPSGGIQKWRRLTRAEVASLSGVSERTLGATRVVMIKVLWNYPARGRRSGPLNTALPLLEGDAPTFTPGHAKEIPTQAETFHVAFLVLKVQTLSDVTTLPAGSFTPDAQP
jgi:hypothetical protein